MALAAHKATDVKYLGSTQLYSSSFLNWFPKAPILLSPKTYTLCPESIRRWLRPDFMS
jgi:hypothetical protein